MNKNITKAIILAAGFGKRMQPITDVIPKPLVELGGRTMIDILLDKLKIVGIREVFVNTHHLADKLSTHLSLRDDIDIHIFYEDKILDTGGGVKNMLPLIGDEDVIVINGDIFWLDVEGELKALELLLTSWQPEFMDILIMLYDKTRLPLISQLKGDYNITDNRGLLSYRSGGKYIFAGPRIVNLKIFKNIEENKFSFKKIFDMAEENKKLFGCVYGGSWYHIGTVEELEYANNQLLKDDNVLKTALAI